MTTTVKLVVSDVDGTLVTSDKTLTAASSQAVKELGEAGIAFAITSGRPPRGMAMLVEPLDLSTPIGGFNGGLLVDPAMRVLAERTIPSELVVPIHRELERHGLDVWSYQGNEWIVRDANRPHVAREAATVGFEPTVRDDHSELTEGIVKLVGVSDDRRSVTRTTEAMRDVFGDRVSASPSQPYYLDVTHPDANKGCVVAFLSETLGVAPQEIATIGDMPNDVLMFAHSGLSIAMGNADRGVQRAAKRVTLTNDRDGFAHAIRRFVLDR